MNFSEAIGSHPNAPNPFGVHLTAVDEQTDDGVPHRLLKEGVSQPTGFAAVMRQWMITHHASPEMLERDRLRIEATIRLGFGKPPNQVGRFPKNPNTKKGNWAEILLAEYLGSSCNANVPVYRLHYNPNVDQSMKGDDVLAFDLDSKPVRILVGEAKFRSTPSKKVVEDIVDALTRSHRVGIPVSLQFVADRLFERGHADLGKKVERCSLLFALGQLRLDYVGLLVSDVDAPVHVRRNAKVSMHRLAILSLALDDPEGMVSTCYRGLENQP
jgi:hypothetical protein